MKIFCNCEKHQEEILKVFENTILQVLTSIEKTNNKFYEMAAKIEVEHFKQLTEITDNQGEVFSKNVDKLLKLLEDRQKKESEQFVEKIEKLSTIDTGEQNSIEKEEQIENPLAEFDPASFRNIKNIQFEGEEEIYPIQAE